MVTIQRIKRGSILKQTNLINVDINMLLKKMLSF